MSPDEPTTAGASGDGQPRSRPRWAAAGPKAPATPAAPEEQQRLAERRLREEMARHRRAEQEQITTVKWGCITVLTALVVAMIIVFVVSMR